MYLYHRYFKVGKKERYFCKIIGEMAKFWKTSVRDQKMFFSLTSIKQGLRKDSEAATNWSICSAYFNLQSQRIKLQLKAEFERRSLKPKLEAEAGSWSWKLNLETEDKNWSWKLKLKPNVKAEVETCQMHIWSMLTNTYNISSILKCWPS